MEPPLTSPLAVGSSVGRLPRCLPSPFSPVWQEGWRLRCLRDSVGPQHQLLPLDLSCLSAVNDGGWVAAPCHEAQDCHAWHLTRQCAVHASGGRPSAATACFRAARRQAARCPVAHCRRGPSSGAGLPPPPPTTCDGVCNNKGAIRQRQSWKAMRAQQQTCYRG
jgi:hypothetical protein